MKKYGYCRVSTSKQNIERQVRNIKGRYPDAKEGEGNNVVRLLYSRGCY